MNIIHSFINANVSQSSRHNHACWEVVYRLSGTTDTTIGGQTHHISCGDLYLVPPYVYHIDTTDDLFTDLAIHVDFLDISDVLLMHDYESYASLIVQMIHRLMTEKEYNYLNIANSLMEALCQYIKRLSHSVYHNPFVYKLKNMIYANIENDAFDLACEIKNTGFHPDYVRRCFKAETGKAPLAYLTGLRMDKAKQMLTLQTYQSIENVAAGCGFRDPFYFSTCFKKHTGLSPLQYRKQNMPK